jgi:uncharacterized protein YacL
MALWILRTAFLLVAGGLGYSLTLAPELERGKWIVFPLVMIFAIAIIAGDVAIARKRIELISSIYIGIVVGIFLTFLVRTVINPLFDNSQTNLVNQIILPIGVGICYICVSLLIQTKDDFRFIIPYVEFSREIKGLKPYVLDTSVVIDGRIADLVETGVLDNQLVMPRFVLAELQSIADSGDKLRRSRGRRGLDILNRLRTNKNIDLNIYERELKDMQGQPVDMKLVLLAKYLEGKVVTGDYNLNKVARLHNVPVINLNDIANSLKPVFLPGEDLEVSVVKPGEEQNQGVGYLDDGTMIVIEDGRRHVGETVRIVVTSVLQTSAGRMIFGKFDRKVSKAAAGS